MKQLITLKIDVTKIDKKRLFKSEKTGSVYLDAVVFLNDEPDPYGNFGMITQAISKEEREAGTKGVILGNVKVLNTPVSSGGGQENNQEDDDLPF